MTAPGALLVRADCGPATGLGHVMRCSAIAAAARRRGWAVRLLTDHPEEPVLGDWRALGASVLPAPQGEDGGAATLLAEMIASGTTALLVDRYDLPPGFWPPLSTSGIVVAAVDDLGVVDPAIDLVVNPNPGAETTFAASYSRAGCVLLGVDHALVRPGVGAATPTGGGGLLVSLGGGEVAVLGTKIAASLAAFPGPRPIVVVGGGIAPSTEEVVHIGRCDLAPHLATADVVVCGGGVTAVEAVALGRPAVVVILAENQRPGALAMARAGAVVTVDDPSRAAAEVARLLADPPAMRRLADRARRLIDGRGGERVMTAIVEAVARRADRERRS